MCPQGLDYLGHASNGLFLGDFVNNDALDLAKDIAVAMESPQGSDILYFIWRELPVLCL
jgi:hypothetical protein